MKKIMPITFFVVSALVSHVALAVSEGGTGAPQVIDGNLSNIINHFQWLLSYWPF